MAVIEALMFATAAGFGLIVVATIVVVIGVWQEERRWTLGGHPPTIPALLARRVLGAYVGLLPEGQPERDEPDEEPGQEPPWYEHPPGLPR